MIAPLLAAGLALAGHWWIARRRGLQPLGPRPEGDLQDTRAAAWVAMLAWLVVASLVQIAVATLQEDGKTLAPGLITTMGVLPNLAAAGVALMFIYGRGRTTTANLWTKIRVGLESGLVVQTAVVVVGFAVTMIYIESGMEQPSQRLVEVFYEGSALDKSLIAFTASFIAPVAEEILFRATLLPLLMRWIPRMSALLVQAALFGAVHISAFDANAIIALPLAVFGLLAGMIYLRTGSLVVVIVLHMTFNMCQLVVALTS